jgi:hypothetical protein
MKMKTAVAIIMVLVVGLCSQMRVNGTCYYFGGCYAVEEFNCNRSDPYQRFECYGWEDVPGTYQGATGTSFAVHNVADGVDEVMCADDGYYCSYWYTFECNGEPFLAEVRVNYDEMPLPTGWPCYISLQ